VIDLLPDDDQQELVDGASSFLEREMPRDRLRASAELPDRYDRAFFAQCGELGWFGLALGEDVGGVGLTAVDEVLLFRELGRHLVPGPFLGTVLGGKLAVAAGETTLAEKLIRGAAPCGLAEIERGGDVVLWDSGSCDYLLVVDPADGAARLVDRSEIGDVAVRDSIDPSYRLGRAPRAALGSAVVAVDESRGLVVNGVLLVAAMLVGIAEAARDESAAYALERVQFGKQIGSFQAVKHRCADTALRAEAAWAQTAVASLRFAQVRAEALFDVAAAKIVASDAAVVNSRDNIQNHGGIGYTAEHDAHLFVKRAHVLERMLGLPRTYFGIMLDSEPGW
jgi:alkylation response protein AidB-like acyl-CoA dehydrogenase